MNYMLFVYLVLSFISTSVIVFNIMKDKKEIFISDIVKCIILLALSPALGFFIIIESCENVVVYRRND